MNKFKVTLKRIEAFYQDIVVEAATMAEAWLKADDIACEGGIEFDYLGESDLLDEHIINVEKIV